MVKDTPLRDQALFFVCERISCLKPLLRVLFFLYCTLGWCIFQSLLKIQEIPNHLFLSLVLVLNSTL